jgi:chromosome partitioning protein
MRKIAILGLKGGIGKTTTCVSLGAALALRGRRVLLIDTDTQANVTLSLGVNHVDKTLVEVLTRKASAIECVVPARPNLHVLPSSLNLFKAQQRMVLEVAREELFLELFAELHDYDYHILDCAPSASLLTVNAVAYVDEVYIPVSMEMLALAGARQFMIYLRTISRMLGRSAAIRLIVPTFFDARRRVSGQVYQALLADFGDKVTHPIRIDTALSEAPGRGKTIFEFAPRSRGADDYSRLADLVETLPPLS